MNKKLQVFVSSTFTDLIEERQAAVEAILNAGHIPAGMELFKAGNESQLDTIYRWIDESDVYMLILGGRYGTIELKSGKSYTQLEYEYALSKDIPVFAVVLSDSFITKKVNSIGLNNAKEQIAPDKYHAFKELVMSKIIKEVNDCKDIKISIHATLSEFIQKYNFVGWVRSDTKELAALMQKRTDELIDIFRRKLFKFPEEVLQEKAYFQIDAISLFAFCYKFYSDYLYFISNNSINAIKNNYLYREISPFFMSFGLIKQNRDMSRFELTQFGNQFYAEIESKNVINNNLVKRMDSYYQELIINGYV